MSTPAATRVARPLARRSSAPVWWRALLGVAMLAGAGVLALQRWSTEDIPGWLLPALLFLLSLGLTWSPLDGAFGQDARRLNVQGLFRRDDWLRLFVGFGLGITALGWFATWDYTESIAVRSIVTSVVVVLGVALMLAPWWLRLIRQVSIERMERIREHERAEIAAHLHDSVLQTLTLIRARADEPETVSRLARAQERDLRSYLYADRADPSDSVATALADAIAEVEDVHSVAIDTVTVGDAPLSANLAAAVAASKEAATNAARHGIGPISVYAEVTADAFEVFVRDGGPGFDADAIPEDRMGIRQSIMGRVQRHHGRAVVQSNEGGKTEVTITVPKES
ncbi:histidine kinase [Demequina sp. B12]|uniref:sensor histidine kinase n=1 Tax=Demequina sp. B12 TaxID=2992757 RepID=UPI00237B2C53|nr:ATP-binding protein [Demequina sp. B12]MDE0572505.1 histidine kinase [Demequina sp. B12]